MNYDVYPRGKLSVELDGIEKIAIGMSERAKRPRL
jgi:hypothetical protein